MISGHCSCPDEERICALVDGAASDEERATVVEHLEACARCRELVAVLLRPSASIPAPLPRPGDCIGDYELVRVLGVGGMGVVYQAHDRELDRHVAVKILRSSSGSGESERRMLRESRAMARLTHPNVIAIHHIDRWQGHIYMVMELVDGTTLTKWLGAEVRAWTDVARMFYLAGTGLAAAHDNGLVHRDFKPDNVLVRRDGHVLVGDFGLAIREVATGAEAAQDERAAAQIDSDTAHSRLLVGTPAYLAPEILRGDKADARADQFSFAVALYEGLWGRHPFPHASRRELFEAVQTGAWRPPPPRPRIPRRIRREILRALHPDPDARAPSLEPLLAALAPGRVGRRRWLAASLGVASAAVASILVWPSPEPAARASCSDEIAARVKEVWHPARKAAIRAALDADASNAAARRWRHVEEALDRYLASWGAMAEGRCAASRRPASAPGSPSPRSECLDDRLRDFDTTAELLATPDPMIASHAIEAAESLEGLDSCTSRAAPLIELVRPGEPETRAYIASLRRARARATVLARVGRTREAIALLVPLEEEARRLGPHPVLAEIQLSLGKLLLKVDGPAAAVETLRKAALSGEATRQDEVAAEAWIRLMELSAQVLHDAERARDYSEHAGAALERLGRPGGLLGHYLLGRGHVAWELESDARRALELYEQAEQSWQDASPDDVFRALAAMARVHQLTGDPERALELERAILKLRIARLGPDHPSLAGDYMSLGIALMYLRRFDEAIGSGERGVALAEVGSGPVSHELAASIRNLGTIYLQAGHEQPGRLEQAERAYRRARAISESVHGADGSFTIRLSLVLADALREQKKPEQAAAIYAAELPRLEKAQMGEENVAATRANYALVLADLGRFRESHELARSAATYYERIADGKPTLMLGLSLMNLARAEEGLGRRAAGLATATRAIEILRSVNASPALIKQLEANVAEARRKAG